MILFISRINIDEICTNITVQHKSKSYISDKYHLLSRHITLHFQFQLTRFVSLYISKCRERKTITSGSLSINAAYILDGCSFYTMYIPPNALIDQSILLTLMNIYS
jgi:hypothetical protein